MPKWIWSHWIKWDPYIENESKRRISFRTRYPSFTSAVQKARVRPGIINILWKKNTSSMMLISKRLLCSNVFPYKVSYEPHKSYLDIFTKPWLRVYLTKQIWHQFTRTFCNISHFTNVANFVALLWKDLALKKRASKFAPKTFYEMRLYLNSQSLNQKRMTQNALTAVVIRHPCSKMVERSSQLVFAAASFLELATFSE